jgi:hypothetical protein
MNNILKGKYFLLLFLVFFFVLSPNNASADEYQNCGWETPVELSQCASTWLVVPSNCSGAQPDGQVCCCEKKKNPATGEWETIQDQPGIVDIDWNCVSWLVTPINCLRDWLAEWLSKIFIAILAAITGIAVFVSASLSALALKIMTVSLAALINVPIIGADIVVRGWDFVRNFANLFFILFFVIIGLATILKIESYKFQKTLPLLILMALLVNFSLVLVGLVADVGNILTGLFVSEIQSQGSNWNVINSLGDSYIRGIGAIFTMDFDTIGDIWLVGLAYISYGVVLSVFFFMMVCVFWVVIFLLTARIAILWLLAILSPLAFVSYIFESTRKMIWTKWFQALVQWSLLAVPILFFMFLSFTTLQLAPSNISEITTSLGITDPNNPSIPDLSDPSIVAPSGANFQEFLTQLIAVMITPMISLIMLLVGIMISLTFAPEGAQGVINASSRAGGWVKNTAGYNAMKIRPVNQAVRGVRQRMEMSPLLRSFGLATAGAQGASDRQRSRDQLQTLDNLPNDATRLEYLQSLRGPDRHATSAAYLDRIVREKDDITPEVLADIRNILNDAVSSGAFSQRKLENYAPTLLPEMRGEPEAALRGTIDERLREKTAKQLAEMPTAAYTNASQESIVEISRIVLQQGESSVDAFLRELSPEKGREIRNQLPAVGAMVGATPSIDPALYNRFASSIQT